MWVTAGGGGTAGLDRIGTLVALDGRLGRRLLASLVSFWSLILGPAAAAVALAVAAAACGTAALAGLTLPFSSVVIGFFCIEDLW